jgi:multidrug resistance protein MdtO
LPKTHFGLQDEHPNDPEFRSRCAYIAKECGRLVTSGDPQLIKYTEAAPQALNSLLDRVEATLHSILAMPVNQNILKNKELAALPSNQVPLLIPGAIGERDSGPARRAAHPEMAERGRAGKG